MLRDGHLQRILGTHARQQQRRDLDLVLATLSDTEASNLKDTLLRLRHTHICPELLAGSTGRTMAIKDCRRAGAARDTAD